MRSILFIGTWMLISTFCTTLDAQHIVEGVVMEENVLGELVPLEFVHVIALEEQVGTSTDSSG